MKKNQKTKKPNNNHGGARPGAGRKPVFDEPTVKRAVPARLDNDFQNWLKQNMVKK